MPKFLPMLCVLTCLSSAASLAAEGDGELLLPPLPIAAIPVPFHDDREVSEGLARTAQIRWQEPVELPPPPAEPALLQAFLVEKATVAPIGFGPLLPCSQLRQANRRLARTVRSISGLTSFAERALRNYQEAVLRKGPGEGARLKRALEDVLTQLNAEVGSLQESVARMAYAAPDRTITYRLRLHPSRAARKIESGFVPLPETTLVRARYADRQWLDLPADRHSVYEGFVSNPQLEADGKTWRLERRLSAVRACTANLAFALEFLTEWRPKETGSPSDARKVTIRTHAWIYDR